MKLKLTPVTTHTISIELPQWLSDQILAHKKDGRKIEAIKLVRTELPGLLGMCTYIEPHRATMSLKQAKDLVESIWDDMPCA